MSLPTLRAVRVPDVRLSGLPVRRPCLDDRHAARLERTFVNEPLHPGDERLRVEVTPRKASLQGREAGWPHRCGFICKEEEEVVNMSHV